jgi:DNA-binding transcriptional LysR family regulator
VASTDAVKGLPRNLAPHFEQIENDLNAVRELREKPAGAVRITAIEYATDAVLLLKLAKFLLTYPDTNVEIVIDCGLTDIVERDIDAAGAAVSRSQRI